MENLEDQLHSFPATQWSLVERAGQGNNDGRREALSLLLCQYLPALRAHLVLEKRLAGIG